MRLRSYPPSLSRSTSACTFSTSGSRPARIGGLLPAPGVYGLSRLFTPRFSHFLKSQLGGLETHPTTFDYRRPGYDEALTRHLEPWGVVRFSGRWYVVGLDTDRGEERVFRLSRVVGPAVATGPTAAFEVPLGTDVHEVARRLAPAAPADEAVVLVRPGAGAVLRRNAGLVEPDVAGPDERTPWDRVRLPGFFSRAGKARLRPESGTGPISV